MYLKFRVGEPLAYAGVSSSATINSNQQFSNGAQLKVPAHLGGIAIFVCFAIAVVSLGFSFAIVPRQLMPWTGLILVYEWTFTLFFLSFGGFLHLTYKWGKTTVFQGVSFSFHVGSFDDDSGKGVDCFICLLLVTFAEHTNAVTALHFMANNHCLLSSSLDGTVRAWDLFRYRNFRTFTTPSSRQFVHWWLIKVAK